MPVYQHTHIGYTSLALTLPFVFGALAAWIFGDPPLVTNVLLGLLALPNLLLALGLYKLTVVVDDTHITWSFGPGIFRKQILLADITGVEVINNTRAFGFGMRVTRLGTLYTVSGHRAVAISVKTPWKKDKVILLGTDEPDVLAEVLLRQTGEQPALEHGPVEKDRIIIDKVSPTYRK